ncbi:FAD/NAD(P)-binding oxidoreductase family protein [Actinidia rufa]|uniref:FAD/NAD(P)-binding oxidoreductase family protein n=1 Tax=Actinidia rufa TaxID=165716 RepID=A0A7J0EQL1_9ERIC|nr:FAD/NAD(P)-binding oxidoreductase family protein [Actinidia rufa]
MGGGNFVVPVQTITDFLENKLLGASVPPSSYRMGVKGTSLHDLFPSYITEALQNSISMFDKELPGFISSNALLHGVEIIPFAAMRFSIFGHALLLGFHFCKNLNCLHQAMCRSGTRTSSPIQIPRCTDIYESTLLNGLYPVGEGAVMQVGL